jgi:uncharacterized protein (DUF2236 family)
MHDGLPKPTDVGPGGAFVEKISASNRLSVSSGLSPRSAAMPLATNFSKLKPLPRKPWKNFGGVIAAVAAMWATTSRTLHPAHSEGVSQASAAGSVFRSRTRAWRSGRTRSQISILTIGDSPPRARL